jgi:hypothetical protein
MNILNVLKQLRDDIKTWVTNNLNALNTKIDEKTIPIDSELSLTSTNPVQNKAIKKAIDNIPTFSGDYNDLTNAPDISEDNSGNMIIADESGNIIFKADADGIHTTAVFLNGEAAATEKYVDDAITKIPTPDVSGQINAHNTNGESHADIRQAIEDAKEELSESIVAESNEWKVVDEAGNIIFSVDASGAHTTELTLNGESAATESYVDNAIANIDFPETDLTDYATKKYVDDAVDGIDFTGYATETYVDNKVADLVNSAPEALNTLGELATALEKHEDAYDALLETVGSKATHTDLETLKEELSESIVSEADEWKVVDNDGNIIFSVDAGGAHTTSLTLNGQSVEDMIGDKVDKVDGKGLSTNDFTNAYKEKLDGLENITFEESDPTVPAWAKEATKPTYTADEVGALPDTTVIPETLADLADDTTHRTVTDAEKDAWNAKSDFSGDYNDLENAPNITEDASNNLVITDPSGNIIFRSGANGIETTQLTVQSVTIDGQSIEELIEEVAPGGIDGITSTTNKITMDRPLEIITTESTEIIEPGYPCVVDYNNSIVNVTLTDGAQYAVNGGLYLEIPYLTSYGEASNIKFIPVGGSFSIYEPDYGYDCNFYLRSYTNLEITGYMISMYDGQTIKIVKKQLAGDITISPATFDALNNTIATLENKVKVLEAKLSFDGSNTTLGNIYMTEYDLSEKTINIHSMIQNGGYDSYVGTLTFSNGYTIMAHRAYYSRVDIKDPGGNTTTIYDQYMSTDDDYVFASGTVPSSITLAYYNEGGSMEWERECTAEEFDDILGVRLEIEGGASVGGNVPVKGVDYWTEEDKAEIKAYIDQAILGGEW